MTKQEVLEIFVKADCFVPPDAVCRQLRGFHHRSSVYSYLFRLHRQGLLCGMFFMAGLHTGFLNVELTVCNSSGSTLALSLEWKREPLPKLESGLK